MPNYNDRWITGYNRYNEPQQPANVSYSPNYGSQSVLQLQPQQQIFVQGVAGAQAYPFPPGCNFLVMWEADPELSIFYTKGLDPSTGRPTPVEVFDYNRHVDPPSVHPADLNNFVTQDQLKDQLKALIENLSVGAQGRIVLNESDA